MIDINEDFEGKRKDEIAFNPRQELFNILIKDLVREIDKEIIRSILDKNILELKYIRFKDIK